MPRISLEIHRLPSDPALQIGYALDAVRVIGHVSLKIGADWSRYRHGIIDTGAAVSLFPAQAWRDADHQIIGPVRIGGVVPRDECRVSARLAKLTCALSDGVAVIGPLTIHAYLADSNEVPLLLGVSDLLETGVLSVAISKAQATFEH